MDHLRRRCRHCSEIHPNNHWSFPRCRRQHSRRVLFCLDQTPGSQQRFRGTSRLDRLGRGIATGIENDQRRGHPGQKSCQGTKKHEYPIPPPAGFTRKRVHGITPFLKRPALRLVRISRRLAHTEAALCQNHVLPQKNASYRVKNDVKVHISTRPPRFFSWPSQNDTVTRLRIFNKNLREEKILYHQNMLSYGEFTPPLVTPQVSRAGYT